MRRVSPFVAVAIACHSPARETPHADAAAPARALGIDATIARDFPGWTVYKKSSGDLNGDGAPDTVVILSRRDQDSGSEEANLAVYFANGAGVSLRTTAPKALCVACGGVQGGDGPFGEVSIEANGTLTIDYLGGGARIRQDTRAHFRLDPTKQALVLVREEQYVVSDVFDPKSPSERLEVDYAARSMRREMNDKKSWTCAMPASATAVDLASYDYLSTPADVAQLAQSCKR